MLTLSRIVFICASLLLVLSIVGCDETGALSHDAPLTEAEAARVVHFEVTGMACTGCAATVRNTISKIDGVTRCSVSYEDARAEVLFDTDSESEQEAIISRIIEMVTDDGFTIEPSAG